MFEKFEAKGYWWLPNDPKNKVPGLLEFDSKDGALLFLWGLLGSLEDNFNYLVEANRIFGISTNGKLYTLDKCSQRRFSTSFTDVAESEYRVASVFEGGHVQTEIHVSRLQYSFVPLREWFGKTLLNRQYKFKRDDIKSFSGARVEFETPAPSVIALSPELNLELHISCEVSHSTFEAPIKQWARLDFALSNARDLKEVHRYWVIIHEFFCLAVGKPINPNFIIIELDKDTTDASVMHLGKKTLSQYHQLPDVPAITKDILPSDMFITFKDVENNLSRFLAKWFSVAEDLRTVRNIYFNDLFGNELLPLRFLHLTQAVEAYHRARFEGEYLTGEDHAFFVNHILSNVPRGYPDDFIRHFKKAIEFTNEYTLRKRFREVNYRDAEIISIQIPYIEEFIEDVVNTRNYLTHRVQDLELKAIEGVDLFKLCDNLKFVLEICLLREMGLSLDLIKSIVRRDTRYRYIREPGFIKKKDIDHETQD